MASTANAISYLFGRADIIQASPAPMSYLERRGLTRIVKRGEYCSPGRRCGDGYHCISDTLCRKNTNFVWTAAFGVLLIICLIGICIRRRRASKAIVSEPTVVAVPGAVYAPPSGDPNLAYQQPAAYPPSALYPTSNAYPTSTVYPPSTDAYPLTAYPPTTTYPPAYPSTVPYGEKPIEPTPSAYSPYPAPAGASAYSGPNGAQAPPPQYPAQYPAPESAPQPAPVPYPMTAPAPSSYPVPQGQASNYNPPH
ncbi:hypothetical protein BGZ76_001816 [Entomortierella beljakovae]|nr:hypothetical protein BGZ76_001816 [Entomortierella beljakovae]